MGGYKRTSFLPEHHCSSFCCYCCCCCCCSVLLWQILPHTHVVPPSCTLQLLLHPPAPYTCCCPHTLLLPLSHFGTHAHNPHTAALVHTRLHTHTHTLIPQHTLTLVGTYTHTPSTHTLTHTHTCAHPIPMPRQANLMTLHAYHRSIILLHILHQN